MSAFPVLTWTVLRGQNGGSYWAVLFDRYGGDIFSVLKQQLDPEIHALWLGWVETFGHSVVAPGVAGALLLAAMAGVASRLISRKFDSIYLVFYLAMISVWPFPAEGTRFVFVIVPILLAQAVLVAVRIRFGRFKVLQWTLLMAGFGAPFLVVLPELLLTEQRFFEPLSEKLAAYKRVPWWYLPDSREGVEGLLLSEAWERGFRGLSRTIPTQDCVYVIKPSVARYLSGRVARPPPRAALTNKEFDAALGVSGCRYFYLIAARSPTYPEAMYLLARLQGRLELLETTTLDDGTGTQGVGGMLARLRDGPQKGSQSNGPPAR